jgi:hypothetical protein
MGAPPPCASTEMGWRALSEIGAPPLGPICAKASHLESRPATYPNKTDKTRQKGFLYRVPLAPLTTGNGSGEKMESALRKSARIALHRIRHGRATTSTRRRGLPDPWAEMASEALASPSAGAASRGPSQGRTFLRREVRRPGWPGITTGERRGKPSPLSPETSRVTLSLSTAVNLDGERSPIML